MLAKRNRRCYYLFVKNRLKILKLDQGSTNVSFFCAYIYIFWSWRFSFNKCGNRPIHMTVYTLILNFQTASNHEFNASNNCIVYEISHLLRCDRKNINHLLYYFMQQLLYLFSFLVQFSYSQITRLKMIHDLHKSLVPRVSSGSILSLFLFFIASKCSKSPTLKSNG